jgi:CubicO group peptidase (beta-lactamase class C family)
MKYPIAIVFLLFASSAIDAEISGELRQWHTVTLTCDGPESSEEAIPNPFADCQMTVWFIHAETSQRYEVPGFFAADGKAAQTSATKGDQWRARFSPPLTGRWTFKAELRQNGKLVELNSPTGEFSIEAADTPESDFRHHGHLRYIGERYLQFAGSKKYFLKAGVDSPETLLGYHDIDGTWRDLESHPFPAPHNPIDLPSLDQGLHRYPDHVKDWRDGDPTWQDGKGKGLIGGMNYLADVGVNSVYFLTMNVNGDGRNVWPWTDPWKHDRFDVSKLAQWEIVFEHMQSRGIQMHVVLQETENDHMLDGGELGPARKLYLREIIARFAHHPAVVWNLGEENLQTTAQQQAMADFIRGLDPYDHPIVIHNDHYSPTNVQEMFDPHLGKSTLDGTALQDFQWNDVHYHTKKYVSASRKAGKPWVVCADEMGGAQFGLRPDAEDPEHFDPRSKGLWGNLMGGGAGVEWYFGWQNNSPQSDLSAETWRPRENMFLQTKHAVDFFQRYLPFAEMQPADHLPLAYADYCLAKPGEVYCIYLFSGGNTRLMLQNHRGPFSVHWFDPRDGGELQTGSVTTVWGPGQIEIGEPPKDNDRDWVCLVRKTDPVFASSGDRIVVEAEHFESQSHTDKRQWHELRKSGSLPELEGVGKPTTWTQGILSAATSASGKRFLRLLPDTRRTHEDALVAGENFTNESGKIAVVSYRVNFKQPGRYYVWVRAFSTGTEDNGVHVGLNGQWPEHGKRMQWHDGKNKWTWGCAQRTEQKHSGVPMQIYLDVKKAGVHTVEFSMREDGFAFDQFLLTKDRDFRPSGTYRSVVAPPNGERKKTEPKADLQSAIDYLKGHCKSDGVRELIIIKDGKTIHEGNNTARVHNIWSCSKSFTSTALGLLISEGKCSLDTLAADIDPNLRALYPNATLRDFTTMTSGFSAKGRSRWDNENSDWSLTPYEPETPHFAPGSAYAYWDEAQMTLGRLLTRVAKQNLRDYLDERVFQPIGMGEVEWLHEGEIDEIPICNGCTNVKLNAKQLAMFGQLFLNKGQWKGKQIIPSEWIEQATGNQVPVDLPVGDTDRRNVRGSGAYGFNWWVNGGENRMPDLPPKTFYASGLHHNVLFVIPEWNMVVVRMGTDGNPPFGKHNVWNYFLKKVGQSLDLK